MCYTLQFKVFNLCIIFQPTMLCNVSNVMNKQKLLNGFMSLRWYLTLNLVLGVSAYLSYLSANFLTGQSVPSVSDENSNQIDTNSKHKTGWGKLPQLVYIHLAGLQKLLEGGIHMKEETEQISMKRPHQHEVLSLLFDQSETTPFHFFQAQFHNCSLLLQWHHRVSA